MNKVFEEYKDIHKGQRVFLIANGPSLSETDLSLIENECSFAMNRISMIYDKFPTWRPTYYLFSSTNVRPDKPWAKQWQSSVVRASKEEKRESVSEFLPSVTISGYVGEQENTNPGDDTNFRPSEQSMTIEQKIFQGGSGVANFLKKKHGQELGEFKLKKVEQEILLEAAEVHTDFLLSQKKVNINLVNIDLLERQVETDQNRLEKGQISLTDLAQSEASLAGAQAELMVAKNDLMTSEANFEKVIGIKPTDNIKKIEKINLNLPESLAAADSISISENPDLIIGMTGKCPPRPYMVNWAGSPKSIYLLEFG